MYALKCFNYFEEREVSCLHNETENHHSSHSVMICEPTVGFLLDSKADTENKNSFKGFISDLPGEGGESVLRRDPWVEADAGRVRGAEWKLRRFSAGSVEAGVAPVDL